MRNNTIKERFLGWRWKKNQRQARKKPDHKQGRLYLVMQGLLAAIVAFCVALGGALCVMTAFDFTDRTVIADLVSWCAAAAILGAVCFSFKKGWIVLTGIAAAALVVLVAEENFLREIRILIFRISEFYNRAYGWDTVFADSVLGELTAEDLRGVSFSEIQPGMLVEKYRNVTGGIAALGIVSALGVSRSLCSGKSAVPGLVFGFLPLGLCCIITDSVPAGGAVFLLLGGLILLLLTHGTRRMNREQGVRLTAVLLVPVMLATVLLSTWLPWEDFGEQSTGFLQTVIGWFEQSTDKNWPSIGGLPETYGTVDLSTVGPKSAMRTEVMKLTSSVSQLMYLRGQAFDVYTGKGWRISEESGEQDPFWPQTSGRVGTVRITTGKVRDLQFLPYRTDELSALRYGKLANPRLAREYSFTLRQTGTGIPETEGSLLLQKCTELPESTRSAARQILEQIGAQGDRRQIVQAIKEYVENSARYGLNPSVMPAEKTDFAIWFLQESDTGYCIHFATAATVLLRAAGIPARYVSGYTVQTEADQEIKVTLDKAHAWVEYLDEEQGWTVLDPTPAAEQETPEPTTPQGTLPEGQPDDTTPTDPPATEEETTAPTRPTLPPETQPEPETKPIIGEEEQQQPVQIPWGWIGAVAGMLAVIGQYLLRRRLRANRFDSGDRNRRALRRWKFAKRMAWLSKKAMPERLTFLAEKAAFSQHMLTRQELEEFDLWLAQAEQALRKEPWLLQLVIRLIWAI